MVEGIHHITAIASYPQQTYNFYAKILGLRLVKRTVNQDDVATYHLFFGDRVGNPGMDLTFFVFQPPMQGKRGVGLITTISLAVPKKSLDFWRQRFKKNGVKHSLETQFGNPIIRFYDPDDQQLELVGLPADQLDEDETQVWTTVDITKTEAIRHFDAVTATVVSKAHIEPALTVLGYQLVQTEQNQHLYTVGTSKRGTYLVVEEIPLQEPGVNRAGTVHHIAFRVPEEATQWELRQKLLALGLYPTPVIDRYYFKSVYFRIPAGILFEIATEGPGFTVDEPEEQLGKKLALPPFLESQRRKIEKNLPAIKIQ